ncbi:MAG: LysM peptidoglycan-binding domain-containing protein [Myxococcales bacterium]|nr:LysM peptidoglycan-binding domain-containing protein [Myxococcales bacterium]
MTPRHVSFWVLAALVTPSLASAQVTVSDQESDARVSARPRTTITLDNGRGGRSNGTSLNVVPEFHTVNRGDTLWDISGYYFNSPWQWPQVWSLNPQITNPHWIFPNDQVRLLRNAPGNAVVPAATTTLRSNGARTIRNGPRYPRGTLFLREDAWAAPEAVEESGSIVGSPEDQMLLSEGDQVYIEFHRRAPNVGESYTVYSEAQATRGSDRNAGRVVRVLGTAIVDAWDAQRHLATARITESIEPIERGERVAVVQRQFQPVPPTPNDRDLVAHVVATPTPRQIVGNNYVVIIDRGENDGVQLGNRFFLTQRDDPWQRGITGQGTAIRRQEIDRDGDGTIDHPPDADTMTREALPVEIMGELSVVAVHPHTAVCLVTLAHREIEMGESVVMRRGY